MALAIQKRMCCRSGRRSVMVKRDRVAGSWLGRHGGRYGCCPLASALKFLGRKRLSWGNARELLHPFTPKPSTPLGGPFISKNLAVPALWDGEGDPVGSGLAEGHLALVGRHFLGQITPNTAELQ